ncbi:MAG: PAS domain-containing protein [Verrucomicrobiota bacterium]
MQVSPAFIQAASRDLHNGICVIDYHGVIDWTNRTFTQYFGYSLDEAQFIPLLELLRTSLHSPEITQKVELGIETGKGCSALQLTGEHKDGTQVDVLLNLIPIRVETSEYFPVQYVTYIRQANERGQTSMVTETCKNILKQNSPATLGNPVEQNIK